MHPLEQLGVGFADAHNLLIHDLRNHLLLVTSNARFVAEADVAPELREAAVDMEIASQRMDSILQNFYAVACEPSVIASGTPTDLSVAPLLAALVEKKRPMIGERLRLLPVQTTLTAYAQEPWLSRALGVLVDNAMHYLGSQGFVDVSARAKDGRVQIRVSDDGPEIPAALAGLVFDAAARVHPDAKRLRLGPIFALPFAKTCCERMGGTLTTEAKSGGATFVIELPSRS